MKRIAVIVAAVVGLAIGGLTVVDFAESRPSHLFRKFIADPIPDGISLVRAESRLSRAVVFLQFSAPDGIVRELVAKLGLEPESYRPPTQPPDWFAPRDQARYWRADGGTKEMWQSQHTVFFKQVNP